MNLYILLSIISLICLVLQFEPMASLSEWHAYYIHHGEWWRIVTGNLTHTNFTHLGMNLTGLWIIGFLFRPTTRHFFIVFFTVCIAVGAMNLLTNMSIYVGLSGVLHGLFAFWALSEVFDGRRSSLLLVCGLIAKIVWEQFYGPSTNIAEMIDARVAVDAHLIGGISGLIIAWIVRLLPQRVCG